MKEEALREFGYVVDEGIVLSNNSVIGGIEDGIFTTPIIYSSKGNDYSLSALANKVAEEALSSAFEKMGLQIDHVHKSQSSRDYNLVIRTEKVELVPTAVAILKEFEEHGYAEGIRRLVQKRLENSVETAQEEVNKSLELISSTLMKRDIAVRKNACTSLSLPRH